MQLEKLASGFFLVSIETSKYLWMFVNLSKIEVSNTLDFFSALKFDKWLCFFAGGIL